MCPNITDEEVKTLIDAVYEMLPGTSELVTVRLLWVVEGKRLEFVDRMQQVRDDNSAASQVFLDWNKLFALAAFKRLRQQTTGAPAPHEKEVTLAEFMASLDVTEQGDEGGNEELMDDRNEIAGADDKNEHELLSFPSIFPLHTNKNQANTQINMKFITLITAAFVGLIGMAHLVAANYGCPSDTRKCRTHCETIREGAVSAC
ncbi:hypothetical protein TI39_contig4278g00019 [Zymoseptoria brevis]|uniref:Transmembrane protein n=1 Tax=Zymoseptoria brevis TaxID=1047168 RepID=A0A0F4G8I7_9PEZI|nr:hypothetical protein TI39_contig4278g00019 [Zymoseptoria brevis]